MRIIIYTIIGLIYGQFVNNFKYLGQFTDVFVFISGFLMIIGLFTILEGIYQIISHFDATKDNS